MRTQKDVIIEYATISPAVLETIIEKACPTALCSWTDIDENYFEFRVYNVSELKTLENVLAKFV